MKDTLRPGLAYRHAFQVTESKLVPALYPESTIFRSMPPVFATGFMVGLMEWACTELMAPHLDPGEGSLGVHVDVSHVAATPAGMTVIVDAELVARDGPQLVFEVVARDEAEEIGRGAHRRHVVLWDRFTQRVDKKTAEWAGRGD